MHKVRTLVVASNNRHKIEEISEMLGDAWKVLSAQDVVPGITWDETGTTFLENARIKAKLLKSKTSHCVLADDSGLCVEALNGAPGVWSSSYGGKEGDHAANNTRLMKELTGVPASKRQAYFQCILVFIDEEGKELTAQGRCHGAIAESAEGSYGFGYDPIFLVGDSQRTMATMSEREKNKISHRGEAMRNLLAKLQ